MFNPELNEPLAETIVRTNRKKLQDLEECFVSKK